MPTLRSVAIDVSKLLPPREQSRLLAEHARRTRDTLIAEGRAAPGYLTYVDGRLGAAEESVRPDGVIRYVFSTLARAAAFALAFLQGASPVLSGEFRRSWIVVVNGARWTRDVATIPPDAVVHLVNTSPYARRLEVGRRDRKPGLGYKLVEKGRQATMRRFPGLKVWRVFLAWGDAYVLKGAAPVAAAKQNRKSSAFRAGRSHLTRRKDSRAGMRITLPAVEIRAA